jgi:DNA-binding transcriptional LysR family regulator
MDRLEEWRSFVAVAERRSFKKAAQAAQRSPQAITRAIAALEARLGTRLLHRTTRSVSLTDEGARLLERARQVLDDVAALEHTSFDRELRGRLTVTAPVLFGQLHVLPIVTEFLTRHAAVTVNLSLLDRVVALAEEGVDLAVRIGGLPDSALRSRPVGQVRYVICASPAYLRRRGTPREPRALAAHDCVAFLGSTAPDRWSFAGPDRREHSVPVHCRLSVNTGQAAVDAALAGLGLVRVLSYQVAPLVRRKRLRLVLERHEPPPAPIHVVQLPGAPVRAASAFADLCAQRLRALFAAPAS